MSIIASQIVTALEEYRAEQIKQRQLQEEQEAQRLKAESRLARLLAKQKAADLEEARKASRSLWIPPARILEIFLDFQERDAYSRLNHVVEDAGSTSLLRQSATLMMSESAAILLARAVHDLVVSIVGGAAVAKRRDRRFTKLAKSSPTESFTVLQLSNTNMDCNQKVFGSGAKDDMHQHGTVPSLEVLHVALGPDTAAILEISPWQRDSSICSHNGIGDPDDTESVDAPKHPIQRMTENSHRPSTRAATRAAAAEAHPLFISLTQSDIVTALRLYPVNLHGLGAKSLLNALQRDALKSTG